MPSMKMNVSCPNPKCPSYGKRTQWYKGDCWNVCYIDTDLDAFCEEKCKWKSKGSVYCFIGDLHWNCSKCSTCDKYEIKTIAASLGKIMAALARSAISGNAQAKADVETLTAIIDKCAERMLQS
mmetsp:Transcript_61634/g.55624  ORF Transcript_61634/g.55624 Transcript_61634/m.55624 type:complete len:124 (+) Transcript_61634:126-497(+)